MASRTWPDELDELLINMWNRGYRASEIARNPEFSGYTRNAVIGRIHRLRKQKGDQAVIRKLSVKPVSVAPVKRTRKRKAGPRPPTPLPVVPPAAPPIEAAATITVPAFLVGTPLWELEPAGCRFIIDTVETRSPKHLYCGKDASAYRDKDGSNCYCAFHQGFMRAGSKPSNLDRLADAPGVGA